MSDTAVLTKRQQEILDCIRAHIAKNGCMPTIREIGETMHINSPNGVMCHLTALEKKGFISRTAGRARMMKLTDDAATSPDELADLRDAIRLIIGRASNIPWKDVPLSEVAVYVYEIRRLKKMSDEPVGHVS